VSISVIAMTHNRHGNRIRNFVMSLLEQSQPPDEIIIVDTSPGDYLCARRWAMALDDSINYILYPSHTFNKSRALNIGIRASKSDYIMTTDIDFIFSPNVIQEVESRLNDKTFVLSEAGYMPNTNITLPFDWDEMGGLVSDVAHCLSPGTIQAAHRQFWFDVHGYDEQFDGGLGGMDDDMWIRGKRYGLELVWIPFGEMFCLHQWHPVSELKGKCSHVYTSNPEIVKNSTGWGNILTHSTCRACGSNDLELLIDYGEMPLAGGFLLPEERSKMYPLRLARCVNCTLMQVLDTIPPDKIFRRYSYTSSTTRTLVEHFAQMGAELVEGENAKGELVVEFGCNDGVLLRPLLAAGAKVVGVDPSDVALRASQKQDWPLINDYFNEAVARQVLAQYGPARIVTGNNVFAHADDLHAILDGVTALLEDDGVFVFEVHYQGDLLNLVQYDTVYHEHVCYYSLTSLTCLLSKHGLKIIDALPIPIHSGSIRVTAARATSKRAGTPSVSQMLESEKNWDVGRFIRQVETRRVSLRRLVEDLSKADRRVVAYGAAGRATILLNYVGLGPDLIEYVVDMSPLRYGRLVPGVLIPIVPPKVFHASPPDYAIMTAWNYEAEIVAKEHTFLAGGGRFIVPLPEIRVVGGA